MKSNIEAKEGKTITGSSPIIEGKTKDVDLGRVDDNWG